MAFQRTKMRILAIFVLVVISPLDFVVSDGQCAPGQLHGFTDTQAVMTLDAVWVAISLAVHNVPWYSLTEIVCSSSESTQDGV